MHLPYHESHDKSSPDRPTLEITPEMIDAGVSALLAGDTRIESEREIVEAIFSAMLRVSGQHRHRDTDSGV